MTLVALNGGSPDDQDVSSLGNPPLDLCTLLFMERASVSGRTKLHSKFKSEKVPQLHQPITPLREPRLGRLGREGQ